MRWALVVVLCYSIVCSVLSAEASEEPSLKILARSSVYNVKETKGIYCIKTNIDEPISWFSPSGKEVEGISTKNDRIYTEKKKIDPNMLALIIHNTKLKDSGNWTCKCGQFSETIEIVVGEKVVMASKTDDANGDEGKNIKLHCEAKGNPTPVVQWYVNNVAIPEDNNKYVIRKREDDYTLEIKNLGPADTGEYMCKVTQKALSHYTDKIITLTVNHKPMLFNPETGDFDLESRSRVQEVYAVLNDTKNITCNVLAYPPPTFKWVRRINNFDRPIAEEDMIFTSEDGVSSTLLLRMRDENDSGQYKCTAINNKGRVEIIFDVTPGEKPIAPTDIKQVNANMTHLVFNVTCLECNITAKGDVTKADPKNLPIDGYSFQLVPHREDYPPDWFQLDNIFSVDIVDVEDTTFVVGPLPNNTKFAVRVRARNAAGFSDWLEMIEVAATTNRALRLVATLVAVIAVLLVALFH